MDTINIVDDLEGALIEALGDLEQIPLGTEPIEERKLLRSKVQELYMLCRGIREQIPAEVQSVYAN